MPKQARTWTVALCSGILLVAIIIRWSVHPRVPHGLNATYFEDPNFSWSHTSRIERVAILSANDNLINLHHPFRVLWDGHLYVNATRPITFIVPTGLYASLIIDNSIWFDTELTPELKGTKLTRSLGQGLHSLTFELVRTETGPQFFSEGLEWLTPMGPRAVSPDYLYPTRPDPTEANDEARRTKTRSATTWIATFAVLALFITLLPRRIPAFRCRETLMMGAIVGLALGLRLVYLQDLVTQVPYFDTLPDGSDHRVYEANARNFVRGVWPPPIEFYRQPGFSWLLGNLYVLLGPSIRAFQIIQITTGSLASIAIYTIGSRIFGSMTGWVAAILWATFPLAIFYDAQLVSHALEAQLVLWIIWFWQRTLISPKIPTSPWGWTVALGLLLGCTSVIRPAIITLIPLTALSVIWAWRSRPQVATALGLIIVITAALPILPVTLHNYYTSGRFQLISSNGPVTLYLGNNRDSAGIGQYSQAFRATHERVNRGEVTYISQTLTDIRNEPRRWVELMARKTALYWSNVEIPNNVDFHREGTEASLLLRSLPIRFGGIVALALTGIFFTLTRKRSYTAEIWLLYMTLLVLFTTTVLFHVVSRFRVPTHGPLIILSAFTLVEIRHRVVSRNVRSSLRAIGLLASNSILIMMMPWLSNHSITPPTSSTLPEGTVPARVDFGKSVKLLAHNPLPAIEPGEPVFITLHWTTNNYLKDDYFGSVQLLAPDGTKISQVDQRMGTGSFPHYPTTSWNPNEIVSDQYLLFPPQDADTPLGATVLVVAYNRQTGERLGDVHLGPLPLTYAKPLTLPDESIPVQALIGPVSLVAYHADYQTDNLELTLYWESQHISNAAGIVFVHLLDAQYDFVRGHDAPPMAGLYPMTAWQVGEGIEDHRNLPLNDLPAGRYTIFVGIYDPVSGARFPVTDSTGASVPQSSLKLFHADIN